MGERTRGSRLGSVSRGERALAARSGCVVSRVFGVFACALLLACVCAVSGCASGGANGGAGDSGASGDSVQAGAGFTEITAEEAHDMMVSDRTVILDVRTQEEYDESHIVNARLLPVDEITAETAAEVAPEKDAPVLVYCRTGVRAETACQTLVSLGYTQVYDFGGIVDWPYETISADGDGGEPASTAPSLPACAKLTLGMISAEE